MSESTNINKIPGQDKRLDASDSDIAAPSEVASVAGSVKHSKVKNNQSKNKIA